MSDSVDRSDSASQGATPPVVPPLLPIQVQTTEALAALLKLQQDVAQAEQRLQGNQSAQIVEANEQLVFAMLRAHAQADAAAQLLKDAARHAEIDKLTDLPNRTLLQDRLCQAIANAKRRQDRLAVMYLDLNRFKQINDTLGHAAGDEVLKCTAKALRSAVRASDIVGRYGGDEFLVLLAEVREKADIVATVEKIIAALGVPNRIGSHTLRLTSSIGISIYPEDGDTAEVLIDRADAAMYRAKRSGRGDVFFHGESAVMRDDKALQESTLNPLTRDAQPVPGFERRCGRRRSLDAQLLDNAMAAQNLQAAAERAQRRQTEFLAVLAHEQRNALAPIANAVALLGRLQSTEPLLPRMQTIIDRQLRHISRLVDDVLDIARVSTGKMRLVTQLIDVGEIVDAAIDCCQPLVVARTQQLSVSADSTSFKIIGDPVRLTQIFSNLLDNASKYTPDGGTITISLSVDNEWLVVAISDTGIGIAADVLPTIFDLFVQDIHAAGFKGDGLGIGLAVVRELVEAHGGKVVASSAGIGLGAKFTLTLPLASRSASQPVATGQV